MSAKPESTAEKCYKILAAYFARFPNDVFRRRVYRQIPALLKAKPVLPGKLEGWMAGLVYAVTSNRCGVPDVLNHDFEQAFGVTMNTVYRRAAAIRRELDL
jgi:hypothetical protein